MIAGGRGRALRDVLIDAARGLEEEVLTRLGPFASWQALVVLWDTGWLGESKRSPRATSAEVRTRLRTIAAARRPIAALGAIPSGTMVCLEGILRESAPDELALEDESGEAIAFARGGVTWVDPRRIPVANERVTVLGFVDRRLEPRATPDGPRRLPRQTMVCAGRFPVVVSAGEARRSGNDSVGALTSKDDRGT